MFSCAHLMSLTSIAWSNADQLWSLADIGRPFAGFRFTNISVQMSRAVSFQTWILKLKTDAQRGDEKHCRIPMFNPYRQIITLPFLQGTTDRQRECIDGATGSI